MWIDLLEYSVRNIAVTLRLGGRTTSEDRLETWLFGRATIKIEADITSIVIPLLQMPAINDLPYDPLRLLVAQQFGNFMSSHSFAKVARSVSQILRRNSSW